MGDTFGDTFVGETPVHTVYVSTFYMDKYETTRALWDEVYRWATNHGYNFYNRGLGKAANHPVHSINWYDMAKWCNARSEKEGFLPAYYMSAEQTTVFRTEYANMKNDWVKWNAGYRLPTEAEWEKAGRGGASGHRFPWSDANTIIHSRANYYSSSSRRYDVSPTRGYHPTFNDAVLPYTSPVGNFAPNGYGLYDMAGNVWERCWDKHYIFSYSGSETDPRGPYDIGGTRVVRGGSWYWYGEDCRVAKRGDRYLSDAYADVGFRSVLPFILPAWCQVPPMQPTYSTCPTKGIGKDSLVVVTHGWNPNITWVETMTNNISQYLAGRGLNNWQVHAHKWVEKATVPAITLGFERALYRGIAEGENLGNCLAGENWAHIHLIAHSAGAALIQVASEKIKTYSPSTLVHTTFLDPYTSLTYGGKGKYGRDANWTDSYFSRDTETVLTEGPLDHAYNVDVTWLDPNKRQITIFQSNPLFNVQPCYSTKTSHAWPHEFYLKTLLQSWPEAEGFGFLLSKEGGNWNFATNQYMTGNTTPRILGIPDPPCLIPIIPQTYSATILNLFQLPGTVSPTGTVRVNSSNSFTLVTGSPVWVVSFPTVTNSINFVSFGATFGSGTGTQGLFSVYWDTNSIGYVDERVVLPGVQQYTFGLPGVFTNGLHQLGFRLDSFTNTPSSITVTNLALGFAGVKEPLTLSFTGTWTNGLRVLQLIGPPGFNYLIEVSTNLITWSTTALLVNTNGIVRFVDSASTNTPARFYRAVVP